MSRVALFAALALGGAGADLASKHWVFRTQWEWQVANSLPDGAVWWIIPNFFGIQTTTNPGALFGMGAGGSFYFAILSVLAGIGIVLWLFVGGAARSVLLTWSLGMISGGIVGNLNDRLGWWRHPADPAATICEVRDWILFQFGTFTWPNFNIADCLLVCGASLLAFQAFFAPAEEGSARSTTSAEQAEPESPSASDENS